MITRFRVQNYKALRDVTLDLTPVHVLIGPNDSGKTTILEAVAALGRLTCSGGVPHALPGRWTGTDLVWQGNTSLKVLFGAGFETDGQETVYEVQIAFSDRTSDASIASENARSRKLNGSGDWERANLHAHLHNDFRREAPSSAVAFLSDRHDSQYSALSKAIRYSLSRMHSYRWIPAHLCLPVALGITKRLKMEQSGFGLAKFLDDILGENRKRFTELEARFTSLFPDLELVLRNEAQSFTDPYVASQTPGKGIYFRKVEGGHVMPAAQMSDGVLLTLAYLALLYSPEPPAILLIEEPENGVHPVRLGDVLKILRELIGEQSRTQAILTTHSPYVVDLFKPEEVTLCRKGLDGAVVAHRLSESKPVRDQIDIFKLGEIWTAEGDEALAAQVDGK